MKRQLLPSSAFVKTSRRIAKRQPEALEDISQALTMLAEDAHHPSLRTHKLKGKLRASWAASAGYDLRIVFQFVTHEGKEAILLCAVGTHDDVY